MHSPRSRREGAQLSANAPWACRRVRPSTLATPKSYTLPKSCTLNLSKGTAFHLQKTSVPRVLKIARTTKTVLAVTDQAVRGPSGKYEPFEA